MASSRDPKRAHHSGLDALVTSHDLTSLGGIVCSVDVVPDGISVKFPPKNRVTLKLPSEVAQCL